jgi:hypothetical protein
VDLEKQNEVTLLGSNDKVRTLELAYRGPSFTTVYPDETRSVDDIKMLAITLVEFVDVMHAALVVHGDIKDSNVGVRFYAAKCFDMELSVIMEGTVYTSKDDELKDVTGGTELYISPELAYLKKCCGYSDVWCIGILLISIILSKTNVQPMLEQIQKYLKIEIDPNTKKPTGVGDYKALKDSQNDFERVLRSLLTKDKFCPQLQTHKIDFFINIILQKLLVIDYSKRATAELWVKEIKSEFRDWESKALDTNPIKEINKEFYLPLMYKIDENWKRSETPTYSLARTINTHSTVILLLPGDSSSVSQFQHIEKRFNKIQNVDPGAFGVLCCGTSMNIAKLRFKPQTFEVVKESQEPIREILDIKNTRQVAVVFRSDKYLVALGRKNEEFVDDIIAKMRILISEIPLDYQSPRKKLRMTTPQTPRTLPRGHWSMPRQPSFVEETSVSAQETKTKSFEATGCDLVTTPLPDQGFIRATTDYMCHVNVVMVLLSVLHPRFTDDSIRRSCNANYEKYLQALESFNSGQSISVRFIYELTYDAVDKLAGADNVADVLLKVNKLLVKLEQKHVEIGSKNTVSLTCECNRLPVNSTEDNVLYSVSEKYPNPGEFGSTRCALCGQEKVRRLSNFGPIVILDTQHPYTLLAERSFDNKQYSLECIILLVDYTDVGHYVALKRVDTEWRLYNDEKCYKVDSDVFTSKFVSETCVLAMYTLEE